MVRRDRPFSSFGCSMPVLCRGRTKHKPFWRSRKDSYPPVWIALHVLIPAVSGSGLFITDGSSGYNPECLQRGAASLREKLRRRAWRCRRGRRFLCPASAKRLLLEAFAFEVKVANHEVPDNHGHLYAGKGEGACRTLPSTTRLSDILPKRRNIPPIETQRLRRGGLGRA